MSRRLAADKRPKNLNLQKCGGWSTQGEDCREGVVSRRRQEIRGDEGDHERYWRQYPDPGECLCLKPGEKDFIRSTQTNVFIDSYYPKLQSEYSEDYDNTEKSLSSTTEYSKKIMSKLLISDRLGIGDSPDSDSTMTFKAVRNAFSHAEPRGGAHRNRRTKGGHRAAVPHSSRSRLTLDSKTYTLFSCASDIEPASSRSPRKPKALRKCFARKDISTSSTEQEEKQIEKETKSTETLSPVDWFARLYKRIETLEEMLLGTLATLPEQRYFEMRTVKTPESKVKVCFPSEAFPVRETEYPVKETEEKAWETRRQKSDTKKEKVLVAETSKSQRLGESSRKVCVAPTPAEEAGRRDGDSDTDNELQKIKKRVRALETKLKQTKIPETVHSSKHFPDYREYPVRKKSLILGAEPVLRKDCHCGRCRSYFSDETVTTVLHRSDTDFPLSDFSPGEKEPCHKIRKKASTKVTNWSSRKEYRRRNNFGISPQLKKNFMTKCKRIKGICSSVISSSRRSSTSNNHLVEISEECNELSYEVTKGSLENTFHYRSFRPPISGDGRQNATVVYLSCQQEEALAQMRNQRKNWKKPKDLCRKTSTTNVAHRKEKPEDWRTGGGGGVYADRGDTRAAEDAWAGSGWVPHPCWVPLPPEERRLPSPPRWKSPSCECETKKVKTRKKTRSSRNPMDILKRGGRIKIPVLFKEICRTSKSREPVQKVSNISIRFVLVEKDSKHPLTKLIKKLSLGRSPQTKERYVFGVSKCRCDNEMRSVSPTCRRKKEGGFIGG